jgi:hypothetical protein
MRRCLPRIVVKHHRDSNASMIVPITINIFHFASSSLRDSFRETDGRMQGPPAGAPP